MATAPSGETLGCCRHLVRGGISDRSWLLLVIGTILSISTGVAHAADPQPYSVAIAGTGDSALDKALADASQLQALHEKAPVGPFALVIRAREDRDRFATVLHSFGYYQSTVAIEIDDHPLDQSDLPDRLAAVPDDGAVRVEVKPDLGPLYHLRHITIDGSMPAAAQAKLGLEPGQPAIASDVLAAGARLLIALQEDGYALAKVDPPIATEIPSEAALDVSFKVDPGRRAKIGAIRIDGLSSVHESFVRRRLKLHSGELYQPSKIAAARQDLASLGVFSGVSAHSGNEIAADGTIPITFDVQERPKHTIGITGAYSTDLGISAKLSWSHRNLFGNAEQLNLSAAATGLGGTATRNPGYDVTAQFIKPDFVQTDQSLEFNLGAIKQSLQAYDQTAETAATVLRRKLSHLWTASIGFGVEQERITQQGVTTDFTLLSLPVTANYDNTGLTDPLQDPTRGLRAGFLVTPTQSLSHDASFFILQASASTYFDLANWGLTAPGRSVVALRGLLGSIQGASQFDVPPDQRFYAGGSATVRGYKYQSVGPRFPDTNPIGGTAIDTGTVELRQRLFGDFGGAAFVDAGQVSASHAPFTGALRIGAGLGLRYYTPIGPIRLDVALPVNPPSHADAFELYIGLGQAF
jgi:translocation and assembly module TamA